METESHVSQKKKKSADGFKIAISAALVVALCGFSFMAGIAFQKKQVKTNVASFSANGGFGNGTMGGGRMGARGGAGTVSAVSTASITVKNTRTNSTTTYAIDSETTVSNNGVTATVADIKVGDTVLAQPSTTDTTKVSKIIVNPTMPSGGPETRASTSESIQLPDDGADVL